jgi:hypothetical protein
MDNSRFWSAETLKLSSETFICYCKGGMWVAPQKFLILVLDKGGKMAAMSNSFSGWQKIKYTSAITDHMIFN